MARSIKKSAAPRVLYVCSECAPWVKTGGLGDVAAALPHALHAQGLDIRLLLPAWPALRAAFPDAAQVAALPPLDGFGHGLALREARHAGMVIYLLECHAFFDRPGHPYVTPEGHDWSDNVLRFGLLSRVAALLASGQSPLAWRPQILHCNDWQTALAPVYLHYRHGGPGGANARSVLGIHNLSFQGRCDPAWLTPLGLPHSALRYDSLEHHGALNLLKGGLQHADRIVAVSPSYAREIATAEGGAGLDGALRHRAGALSGILNGIDTELWNPAVDVELRAPYQPFDAATLAHKAANTASLRAEVGLAPHPDRPLFGMVTRLTEQKGVDLVLESLPQLIQMPAQLVLLGSGEHGLEAQWLAAAAQFPRHIAVHIGYDETLAHRIEAGADFFLMPSRFEPCGLNQMYSLRYGTPPIVRATGGLADTVIDADAGAEGNGIVFTEPNAAALADALRRAHALWQDGPRLAALRRAGMAADHSWAVPAARYTALYQELLAV